MFIHKKLVHTIILSGLIAFFIPFSISASHAATQRQPVSQIAYTSYDGNSAQIFVMDANGDNPRNLTNDNGTYFGPDWSPDGNQLAFVAQATAYSNIYIMDANGENRRQLTSDTSTRQSSPDWSPDGQFIVFNSRQSDDDEGTTSEIYVIDINGGNLTRLTNNEVYDHSPKWSPDGQYIAYTSKQNDRSEIHIMDANGENQRKLLDTPVNHYGAAWSPDGKTIAFITSADDKYEINLTEVDGSSTQTLLSTTIGIYYAGLSWSPDGRYIAYVFGSRQASRIHVLDVASKASARLTNADDYAPVWSPDGDTAIVDTLLDAVVAKSSSKGDLPGANGNPIEFLVPPEATEIVSAFLSENKGLIYPQIVEPTDPYSFEPGTNKLYLIVQLVGVRGKVDVSVTLDNSGGPVALKRQEILNSSNVEGLISAIFELEPESGQFEDGPYQATIYVNAEPVILVNWQVGQAAE